MHLAPEDQEHQNDEEACCEPSEPLLHGLTGDGRYTCPRGSVYKNFCILSHQSITKAITLNVEKKTNLGPIKHHHTCLHGTVITTNLNNIKLFSRCPNIWQRFSTVCLSK